MVYNQHRQQDTTISSFHAKMATVKFCLISTSFFQTRYGNDLHIGVCGAMIGLSSYAGVMDNLKNTDEEPKPKKQESSKNQKAKPVGGFVLVHAGKI